MKTNAYLIAIALCAVLLLEIATNLQASKLVLDFLRNPDVAPEQVDVVATKSFDGWHYELIRDGVNVSLSIEVDDTSPAGLERFQRANQVLAEEMLGDSNEWDVNIVFASPLESQNLGGFARHYRLDIVSYEGQMIGENGDRITLGTSGQAMDAVLAHQNTLYSTTETGSNTREGVTIIRATLPAEMYHQLAADPLVFVVDVTPEYARQHSKMTEIFPLHFQVYPVPLYWDVENMALGQN